MAFDKPGPPLVRDTERTSAVMKELVALGVGLSIDDFGTGHSSLSYLARFPVEGIKIDQNFVRNMLTDDRAAAIVQATVALAHSLGLRAIAEGVEQPEQAIYLRAYQCDSAQGFLFARPLAPDAFIAHLTATGAA